MFWETLAESTVYMSLAAAVIVSIYHYGVYRSQVRAKRAEDFNNCANNLYSTNETAQITSAILLRSFLKRKAYKQDTINLIVALLRTLPSGNMQKTLADSISYIDNIDGQDFQDVNLNNASIKPKSRIMFEITKDDKYLQRRITMKCADFYNADINECSISNINAQEAIFYNCRMKNTTFHFSDFRNASFELANMENVKFKGCELEGANFSNVKALSTIKVFGKNYPKSAIIDYLDSKGNFSVKNLNNADNKYSDKEPVRKIFISKLGLMDALQVVHYNDVKDYLQRAYNTQFAYIDRNDYRDKGQLGTVKDGIKECSGMIVLAFSYLAVSEGYLHRNVEENRVENKCLPSPWMQIEATMANSLGMPILIIGEKGMIRNGIFEDTIVNSESSIFFVEYEELISNQRAIFDKWINLVDNYSLQKTN